MSEGIEILFNGDTIAVDSNKPVKIPGKQADGTFHFFHVCCACGLTHAVHITSDTMEWNQVEKTENKKISHKISKRILDSEDKISELESGLREASGGLKVIQSMAGNPDARDGCRLIIKKAQETIAEIDKLVK